MADEKLTPVQPWYLAGIGQYEAAAKMKISPEARGQFQLWWQALECNEPPAQAVLDDMRSNLEKQQGHKITDEELEQHFNSFAPINKLILEGIASVSDMRGVCDPAQVMKPAETPKVAGTVLSGKAQGG